MIILDTNIISEMMKPVPNAIVFEWANQQMIADLYVSSITIAEISYGLNALPQGSRRRNLEIAFTKTLQEGFSGRILAFEELAAYQYGIIMSTRKKMGQPLGIPDGQIAAIAKVHNASVATRNISDFQECGISLINPFEKI